MKYFIFDLDNCIANDQWRIPHIDWRKDDLDERYLDYHQLAAFDKPHNMDIFRPLAGAADHRIIISTARPITFRALTKRWLQEHSLRHAHLLMRNRGDHRPSVQLKAAHISWLSEYGVALSDVVAAFDDRADVVEMYRNVGIARPTLLSIHDTCAYTKPK